MKSEHRGGEEPISLEPNQLNELPSGEDETPKVNKSRRKFLIGSFLGAAGLAAAKFVPESKASDKELEKETKDVNDAVELSGENLPDWIRDAVEFHNKKHKDKLLPLEKTIFIPNTSKFIEQRKITNQDFLDMLKKAPCFTWEDGELKVHIQGDSPQFSILHRDSEKCGADLFKAIFQAMIEHEAVHFNGNDSEVDAYTAQIDYLTSVWLQASTTRGLPPAYAPTLMKYINQYKQKRQDAKSEKIASHGRRIKIN